MTYDAHTVAVVMVTGLVVVAGVIVTGAAIGGAFWVAMRLEDRAQARNAAAMKETS